MNSKKLKYPHSWEERCPAIADRVLFVPDYYDRHKEWTFPGWDAPELFGNTAPVWVEYCAGNGTWIAEKARTEPEKNWVAVEWRFDRVRKIWSKIQNLQLPNLFVVSGEALTFTRFYLSDASIAGAFVNFPDPWPKEKHAKHRLIQGSFVSELARVIKPQGHTTLVTDDPTYAGQMIQEMGANSSWKSTFPDPFYSTEWPNYGASFFDSLWRGKGCTIRYLNYARQ